MSDRIATRPFLPQDARLLDEIRWRYQDADLEVPHGYVAPNIETALAEKEGRVISGLTATISVTLDPLMNHPDASPVEVMRALLKLEETLTYMAQKAGAVDVYIAIPQQLEDYIKLVEKAGYKRTVENCVVLRRPLRPDTVPLIGDIRDAQADVIK